MSLRRQPPAAATFIPRNANTGFGVTSSGAIGFSEDVHTEGLVQHQQQQEIQKLQKHVQLLSIGNSKKEDTISSNREAFQKMDASAWPYNSSVGGNVFTGKARISKSPAQHFHAMDKRHLLDKDSKLPNVQKQKDEIDDIDAFNAGRVYELYSRFYNDAPREIGGKWTHNGVVQEESTYLNFQFGEHKALDFVNPFALVLTKDVKDGIRFLEKHVWSLSARQVEKEMGTVDDKARDTDYKAYKQKQEAAVQRLDELKKMWLDGNIFGLARNNKRAKLLKLFSILQWDAHTNKSLDQDIESMSPLKFVEDPDGHMYRMEMNSDKTKVTMSITYKEAMKAHCLRKAIAEFLDSGKNKAITTFAQCVKDLHAKYDKLINVDVHYHSKIIHQYDRTVKKKNQGDGMDVDPNVPSQASNSMFSATRSRFAREEDVCRCANPIPVPATRTAAPANFNRKDENICRCADPIPVPVTRAIDHHDDDNICGCANPIPMSTAGHMMQTRPRSKKPRNRRNKTKKGGASQNTVVVHVNGNGKKHGHAHGSHGMKRRSQVRKRTPASMFFRSEYTPDEHSHLFQGSRFDEYYI